MKKQNKRISAYGLITNDREQILLCRLSSIVEDSASKWTLPGGGLDFGENPIDAVIREVKEETGLKTTVGKLLDVDSCVVEFSDRQVHAIRIIYQAFVDRGELKVEHNGSTDACDWFDKSQLKYLPLVSLAQKGLSLLGWNSEKDSRERHDLSLSGLLDHFENQDDPISKMTADYLKEISEIYNMHTMNSIRRLEEMRKYR